MTHVFVFSRLFIRSRRLRCGQVASRHKRPPSRAERGPLPFIPFARLTFASPSATEGSCNFFFGKSGSFFWLITGFVLTRALIS